MVNFDLENWKSSMQDICYGDEDASKLQVLNHLFWRAKQEENVINHQEEWILASFEVYTAAFQKNIQRLEEEFKEDYIAFLFGFCDLLFQDSQAFSDLTEKLEEKFPAELLDHQFEKNRLIYETISQALKYAKSLTYIGSEIDEGLKAYLFGQKYEQIRSAPIQFNTQAKIEDYYVSLMKRHLERVATDEGLNHYQLLLSERQIS